MQNQTLIQYFQWYYNEEEYLWLKTGKEAPYLASLGITKVWLPPAYKALGGANSVGYDPYDLYDLGEFNQKNTVETKYGSKQQYLQAIEILHQNGMGVIADVVFNHKAGGDALETVRVRSVNPQNRNEFISEVMEIKAWTKFTFPAREGKYSDFIWDWTCFSGVDWAEDKQESAIFCIQNDYGSCWENVPSAENGNYDYLMFNDLDFRNPAVCNDLKNWGKWYCDIAHLDGFRIDAAKHISTPFLRQWIQEMQAVKSNLFIVSEEWNTGNEQEMRNFLEQTDCKTQLFDSILHYRFYEASKAGNAYDLSAIFKGTLLEKDPNYAVTFVDNHDTQPKQALESYVENWFRPLAYALILLRTQGTPCVFYVDVYGASYQDKGDYVTLPKLLALETLLLLRKNYAFGIQRDYFDYPNCIGWTREGIDEVENSGLAVLLSNGNDGFKRMQIGQKFAGKIFIDALKNRTETVKIDQDGWGVFLCEAKSVSVWIVKAAN